MLLERELSARAARVTIAVTHSGEFAAVIADAQTSTASLLRSSRGLRMYGD